MADRLDIKIDFRPDFNGLESRMLEVARQSAEEALETDIIPDAVEGSPVAAHLGGTNRRSITGDVKINPRGQVEGRLFTQSGYGGYLEVGTSKMAARPYLRPAVEKHGETILRRAAEKVGAA